jgi:hypothetical protein
MMVRWFDNDFYLILASVGRFRDRYLKPSTEHEQWGLFLKSKPLFVFSYVGLDLQ